MKKIQKTAPNGVLSDATELEVQSADERWSTFTLEDGATIKIRPTALSIWRFDNHRDPDGNPIYQAQVQLIQVLSPNPDLQAKK